MATDLSQIDPAEFFNAQRERWQKQREDALAKLTEADGWLAKFAAFEGATAPKTAIPRRGPQPGTRRGEGGGKRAEVLDLIRQHPEGLTAGQIIEQLNASDKSAKQAIANSLGALKEAQLITQAQKRGPYTPAPVQE